MKESNTIKYTMCALFVAFISVCSQISIFIGTIPISLSLLAVFMAGLILGYKYGTLSVIVYILLGLTGIPVFAGAKGGIAVLMGPTGGFLIGYILCALIIGFVSEKMKSGKVYILVSIVTGLIICYILGAVWFSLITGNSFSTTLKICIIPFIPGDIIKIVVSMFLYNKIKSRLNFIINPK